MPAWPGSNSHGTAGFRRSRNFNSRPRKAGNANKAAAPQRATRDLVFDDEDISFPPLEPAVALQESVDAYTRARLRTH